MTSENRPAYRIVAGPWNHETKKWAKEFGALWPRKEGKPGFAGSITIDGVKHPILVIPAPVSKSFGETAKPGYQPQERGNKPSARTLGDIIDDSMPDF